jgi:hypothetical protein
MGRAAPMLKLSHYLTGITIFVQLELVSATKIAATLTPALRAA